MVLCAEAYELRRKVINGTRAIARPNTGTSGRGGSWDGAVNVLRDAKLNE
jgi:hypothetical protein